MAICRCGCGETVSHGRVFVNKEHQLDWMLNGGARQLNAQQPLEAKQRGGQTAGEGATMSGRLLNAGRKGAARSREIAETFRAKRIKTETTD